MRPYVYLGGYKGMMDLDGMRIGFDTRDKGLVNVLTSAASYEPDVSRAIVETLQPGGVFIDVGANVGIHSVIAGRHLTSKRTATGAGRVLSFEPNASLFPMLQENLILNGCAPISTVTQAAVYDQPGEMVFSYEENQHRVGALRIDGAKNYGETSYPVRVVTLDSLLDELPSAVQILIKIDVEGREEGVLRGAENILHSRPNTSIIMEYHRAVMESTGTDISKLFAWLGDLRFEPSVLTANGRTGVTFDALSAESRHANLILTRSFA